jgi:pilus assembly protein FimV
VLTTIKILSAQLKLGRESGALVTASRSTLWRTPVAAAALALSLGLGAFDAHALALGRVNVLSALGEPLRAEIEVPDINAEEAASLSAKIASGDAFRAAGLEYNAALSSVQISLQRRANGSAYLRLSSDRPINEPFVDIILETTWATGRVVRDYTMLFDPSNMRAQPAPAVTASPSLPAPSANPSPSRAAAPSTSPATAPVRSTERRTPRAAPPVAAAPAPAAKPGSVTVKAGNTATQLAVRYKPEGISLDQMLVAMLSANPEAFVEGNVNRLRKGAVLDMPTAATAGATPADQARQTITAQSKDFNEFRRRLAQGLPTTSTPSASRKAAGTVQAEVQERKPAAAAPDKLTLSKGAIAGASAPKSSTSASKEDSIAKDKQAKDAASRTAELSKNIQDLNKLVTSTVATPAAKPSAAASAATSVSAAPAVAAASGAKPGVTIAAGAPAPSATPTAAVTAAPTAAAPTASTATAVMTTPASVTPTASIASTVTPTSVIKADATTTAASAPIAQVTPAKPKVVAPPPPPEPSLVDSLLDNPLTMPAAGGLLALLAGFGFYRFRQRKNSSQVDSSFLESRLQPDSFFGASGGQRIDTNDAAGAVTGSSMVYSPSQLDAAGDVDPVAEADVYLAYGRDLQAEEILKEAMRTNPGRVAIHAKLMEIYAKRRDIKAFETVANEAFSVTKGQGSEWEAASAMGRDLDPENPLYHGISMGSTAFGGAGSAGMVAAGALAATAASAAFAKQSSPQNAQFAADDNVDFDLDLDFSANDNGSNAAAMNQASHGTTSPIHVQTTVAMKAQTPDSIDSTAMDLIFDSPSVPDFDGTNSGLIDLSPPDLAMFDQKLSFPDPKPAMGAIAPTAPMSITTAPAPAMEALEFDLGDLSLDLPGSGASAASASGGADLSGDPLETKLALAQEFLEIGDNDGARSLAQEVAAEASGALKARAQRMVADLS